MISWRVARLSPLETIVLAAFRRRLVDIVGARLTRTALFGSRARGEGDEDSDLDVFVLVEDLSAADRRAIVDAASDLALEHGLSVSPLVRDPRTFDRATPIARAIEREGVAL
ncbi:MAG: hypothetical protein A2138_05250 [Deltaproteobacteria bacterium RBG_16_71_12]|nr:MAG: hypothetical protein A2138_05250 [Deltaproteobacteria bacterium RBG_16_71_12]